MVNEDFEAGRKCRDLENRFENVVKWFKEERKKENPSISMIKAYEESLTEIWREYRNFAEKYHIPMDEQRKKAHIYSFLKNNKNFEKSSDLFFFKK
jgi:hypothetical protein